MVEEMKIKGWERKRLVDISPLQRGFDLTSLNIVEGNYPVVYSNGILKLHHRYMVKGPGVVTGRSGTIGKVTFVEENYWPHNTTLWVTDFKGNHAKFIYYLLIYLRLEKQASGSGVPTLNRNDIHLIEISIPNIEEQKAIAKVLTDTDNLIHSIQNLIDKKEKIKKGTMQELLTGKKRLDGFSGEWQIKDFNDIFLRYPTKKYQISTMNYLKSGSYPVIDQGKEKIIAYTNRNDKLFTSIEGGVIIFGDHTRVLKYIDFKFVIGADGTQILKAKDGNKTLFFYYKLLNKKIINTGYNRHFKFLLEMIFSTPPIAEQQAIAQILSDMDQEIQGLKEKLEKYKTIKKGMMQELLTGRIRLI